MGGIISLNRRRGKPLGFVPATDGDPGEALDSFSAAGPAIQVISSPYRTTVLDGPKRTRAPK
jgi:hypothetical protein